MKANSSATRAELIEQWSVELEGKLQKRAVRHSLLKAGERLEFEIRIVQGPIVSSKVVIQNEEGRPLLPPDQISNMSRFGDRKNRKDSYKLTQSDWERLHRFTAPGWFTRLINFLEKHSNGPFSLKEMSENCGFTLRNNRQANKLLQDAGNFDSKKFRGAYYKLTSVGSGFYAIKRYGFA